MRRLRAGLIPYLSGVLGLFPLMRELIGQFYDGRLTGFWAFLLCMAVWGVVYGRSYYEVPYLLAALMVLICPLLGISLEVWPVCLILFSFVSVHAVGKHRAGVVTGAVFLALLVLGGVWTYIRGEAVLGEVFWLDRYGYRLYVSLFGEQPEGRFENGNVGRGNNYRSGNVQLDLLIDREPLETIYLRGYIGAEYTGNRWTEADETPFYEAVAALVGRESRVEALQTAHQNLYFLLNHPNMSSYWMHMMQNQMLSDTGGGARTITVYQEGLRLRQYIPYFSYPAPGFNSEADDYFYYEMSDVDRDQMDVGLEELMPSMQVLLQEYDDYVKDEYLKIPDSRLSRLEALCGEQEFAGLEEVTAFIREILQTDTSYTRTPGTTPINQDVIEYFLFESKRGYCMHYASAAALMYRMCGIPARYVTGYVAHPSDFVEQPDGSYGAALTDYSKHAWAEVYQEGLGWVPVEMTPLDYVVPGASASDWLLPAYVTMENVGDGEGAAIGGVGYVTAEEEEEEEEDEEEEEEEEEDEDEDNIDESAETIAVDGAAQEKKVLGGVIGWALFILCVAAALWYRRSRKLQELERMEVRRLFYRLMRLFAVAGRLKGYTGAEKDFAEKLCQEISAFTEEEAEELTAIVREAAYGAEESLEASEREEKRERVYMLYQKASEELYQYMNWLQKLCCTWILNLR